MILISPSILSADFSRLGEEVGAVCKAGADMVHIDVMDGHFVPNLTIGMPVVKSLRKTTDKPFDVHLMIAEPLRYAEEFARAGADIITFHCEAVPHVYDAIMAVKKLGVKVGISVKPATPVEPLFDHLRNIDMVLVMTVEPGFGGQSFMRDMLPKISALRAEATRQGASLDIEVDGGIDENTAPLVKQAGANILVAGSAIFGARDYKKAIAGLRV